MLKIGFIGAGNMAQAMIKGMIDSQLYQASEILVYNHRYAPTLEKVVDTYHVTPILEMEQLIKQVDLVILVVKPNILRQLLVTIKPWISKQLICSIAAGVTIAEIEQELGNQKIIRVMPNTPAMVGEGMSSVSVTPNVSADEQVAVLEVMSSFGRAEVVPESLIDAVVGVSGSAPAYVYLFIEALADGAVAEGMSRSQAYTFAAQTVLGAAKMVAETGEHPAMLKDQVCSPGGTTIAAVQSLEENGFRAATIQAVRMAAKKNREG